MKKVKFSWFFSWLFGGLLGGFFGGFFSWRFRAFKDCLADFSCDGCNVFAQLGEGAAGVVFDEMNAVRVVDAFQAPAVQSPKNKIDNLMQNF